MSRTREKSRDRSETGGRSRAKAPRAARADRTGPGPSDRSVPEARGRKISPATRALLVSSLVSFALLAFGVNERSLGRVSDEQQLAYTSVAIAEFGELGIAQAQRFSVPRPEGDALSPYGVGAPVVFSIASRAAGWVEARKGLAASQSLYALLQCLIVLAAGVASGLLAKTWNGTPGGIAVAVVGTTVASPLWPYASTLFAEPILALSLVGAAALAAASAREGAPRRQLALAASGGVFAGYAVLAKGMAIVLVPFVLLPLLLDGRPDRRWRRLAAAAAGLVPTLGVWLLLEVHRFGRPFASYEGFGFTHPVMDGLWRLTVGPNEGLVLYFPLLLLSVAGVARLLRSGETRGSALAAAGAPLALLLVTSAWWAWDGSSGWGPRLLVPAVPLLAAAAGAAATGTFKRRVAWVLVAAGFVLNSLGVLQPDSSLQQYYRLAEAVPVTPEVASTLPAAAVSTRVDGRPRVPAELAVPYRAELSPFRTHAYLLGLRLTKDDRERDAALMAPPWGDPKPRSESALLSDPLPELRTPFRWPRLFSALGEEPSRRVPEYEPLWADAIADQVLRAVDTGRSDRALALSERLWGINRSPLAAALLAESLRSAGRPEGLGAFLRSLPRDYFSSPRLGVVLALDARDRGDEARARATLREVARVLPTPAIRRAVDAPVGEWPRTLRGMIVVTPPPPAPAAGVGSLPVVP